MPLELGFEFKLNTSKYKKSVRVLVELDLSLKVVVGLLDLVFIYLFI